MDKVLDSNAVGANISISRLIRLRGDKVKEAIGQTSDEDALAYLAELFRGNGWTVAIHSPATRNRALLLSNPRQPDNIVLIVRLLLNSTPVSYDEARHHLTDFEEKLNPLYACSQFCLIALNGFEAKAERLENYNLLLQDWSSIEELLENYSKDNVKEPRIQLFAHNKQSYKKVQRMMKQSNSVAVVQATGTGKSYLIAKLLQDFAGERKLVMAPSYYIIEQIKEHIRWEIDKIEFMTYAKSMNLSQAEIAELKPKMIVLDEFHRCGAEEWGRGVQNILNAYPSVFKFGTSATPVRYLDNARDMSLELFNGHVAENLSLAQAIVRNILPMPKYVCALYTLAEEVSSLRAKIAGSRKNEETKKRLLLELDSFSIDWERSRGIPHVLKKHLGKSMRKFIVFCKDEEHLLEMEPMVVKWFKEATDGMPAKTYRVFVGEANSDENLEAFKGDTSKDHLHLLFSINMLNEGLHVNEVSGVVLLRPTESPNIFYQQIGRCLKVGLSHRPVIFDFVNNFKAIRTHDFLYDLDIARRDYFNQRSEDLLDDRCPKFNVNDEVREITEVFGEIKFKLDNWDEMYDRLVAFKKRFGHCNVFNRWEEDPQLHTWLRHQRVRYYHNKLNEEQKSKLTELGIDWNYEPETMNKEERWQANYQSLVEYKKEHGDCNVPDKVPKYDLLVRWARVQRGTSKKGKLSEERTNKLKAIGFNFNPIDELWKENYRRLLEYQKKHGDCNVPNNDRHYRTLRNWVNKQRGDYKKGEIEGERLDKLTSIGFIFNPEDFAWDEQFNQLAAFVKKFGHSNIPHNNSEYRLLNRWVNHQRENHRRGILEQERQQRLVSIGLEFEPRDLDGMWQQRFDELVAYQKQHGHMEIPETENRDLNFWIFRQRTRYKKGVLDSGRIKKLEKIGFKWSAGNTKKFDKKFIAMLKYKKEHGHVFFPQNHPFNYWADHLRKLYKENKLTKEQIQKLNDIGFSFNYQKGLTLHRVNRIQEAERFYKKYGHVNATLHHKDFPTLINWLTNIRKQYKDGILPQELIEKFNGMGMDWHFNENRQKNNWDKRYAELLNYYNQHGTTVFPLRDSGVSEKLRVWCGTQKKAYKNGKINTERINKLNKIKFEWDDQKDAVWEENFAQLVEFKKTHGSLRIPKDGKYKKLNTWCLNVRKSYKDGILTDERKQRLEAAGFSWDVLEDEWQRMYNELVKYKKRFGDLLVPYSQHEFKQLYNWVAQQRKSYKKKTVSPEHIQKLNALGFVWQQGIRK